MKIILRKLTLEKDMEILDTADELTDRRQGLHDGIQIPISNNKNVEGSVPKSTNYVDILIPLLHSNSVSIIKDVCLENGIYLEKM
jgi:hypothetical protein